jgi:hypothetical protein
MSDEIANGQLAEAAEPVQVAEAASGAQEDHKLMLARLIDRLDAVAVGLDHELSALVAKAKAML